LGLPFGLSLWLTSYMDSKEIQSLSFAILYNPSMRLRFPLALALGALFVLTTAADDPNTVKAGLQKEINRYVAAMKKKDFPAVKAVILANFTSDFKETDPQGTVRTREQVLDVLKQNLQQLKEINSLTYTINSLKLAGKDASTTEKMVLEGTVPDP